MSSWQVERIDAVARLTLARPPVNALDQEALDELSAILAGVAQGTARALVITGGLGNVFCSGGDLRYWRRVRDGGRVSDSGRTTFRRLEQLDIPTVAALNGAVVGDGLALALACDVRLGCERTSFRLPEVGYGFIPGWGPIKPLVDIVGRAEATRMLLTGATYDAARALRVGLLHDVEPAERLLGTATAHAAALTTISARAMRVAKAALRGEDEGDCFREVWGTEDWQEGVDALLAKRPPRFAGKGATE